jgi:hypothetical protein
MRVVGVESECKQHGTSPSQFTCSSSSSSSSAIDSYSGRSIEPCYCDVPSATTTVAPPPPLEDVVPCCLDDGVECECHGHLRRAQLKG